MATTMATSTRPVNVLSMATLNEFDAHPSKSGGQLRFCCPLPSCAGKPINRHHQTVTVNPSDGRWFCQRCNGRGKLREFWEDRPFVPLSRKELARQELCRRFTVPPRSASLPELAQDPEQEERLREKLAGLCDLAGTPGEAYLKGRKISMDVAIAAGVRYHPRWYGRPAVVFVLRDPEGALVAAQGRYVDGREDPKTQSAGRISSGVFATPGAWEAEHIPLCEAPIDALSLAMAGLPTLALCGKEVKKWMPRRLAWKSAPLALDADDAGDDAAGKWESALCFGTTVKRLRPEDAKDWNAVHAGAGLIGLQQQIARQIELQIHRDRAAAALERWRDLTRAIKANILPAVPCVLGYDEEGGRWECGNLRQYALDALHSVIYFDGWGGWDPEPEENAVLRMDIMARRLAQ